MFDSDSKPGYEKLLEELTSPWDWFSLVSGGTVGLIIAYATGGELGTIAAASGGVAIAVRRAFVASFKGSWLKRRSKKLISVLDRAVKHSGDLKSIGDPELLAYRWFYDSGECTTLLAAVTRDLQLYEDGVTTTEQFEECLNEQIAQLREVHVRQRVGRGESLADEADDEAKEFRRAYDQPEAGLFRRPR